MRYPPSYYETPPVPTEVELRTFDAPLCALRREVAAALKHLAFSDPIRRVLRAFLAARTEDGYSPWVTWDMVLAEVGDEICREHPNDPDAGNMAVDGPTQSTLATLAWALGIKMVMLDPDEVEAWDAMQAEHAQLLGEDDG